MSNGIKSELIQVLCEFLEGAIHTAVRARNIYNPEVFERQKLYNIFIGKSRNPQLNDYISSVVQNCKVRQTAGAVDVVVADYIAMNTCMIMHAARAGTS